MALWFSSLYGDDGLFSVFPRQDIKYPQLIISSTTGLPKGKRKFAFFENFTDFINLHRSTPLKQRNFYEVILGEMKQKPHFDIDGITLDKVDDLDQIVEELIKATEEAFKTLGIQPTDLRWYGSDRPDKRSLHLVLPNYYVNNNYEAQKIYFFLRDIIPDYLFRFFDSMVYSTLQNFRMLGSCKNNDTRYKKLLFQEKHRGSFKESLITRVKEDMVEFPYIDVPDIKNHTDNGVMILDDETTTEAVFRTLEYLGPTNFRLYNIKNSFLSFERLNPTHCSICQVYHESIYPFSRVSSRGKLYLYCYRSREYCRDDKEHRIEIHDFGWFDEWLGDLDFLLEEKETPKEFKIDYSDDILRASKKLDYREEELKTLSIIKKKVKNKF